MAFRGTEVETWGSFWDRAGMAMGKKALWRPVRRFPHCPTVMLRGDEPHGWKIDGKTHPEFPLERIAHCRCARSRIAAAPQCERSDLWEKPRTSSLYLCRSLSQHLKTTTRKLLSGVPTPNARLFCGRNPFPACSPHRRSVLCKKFILLLLFPLQPSRKTRGVGLDFLIITFISIFFQQRAKSVSLRTDFKAISAPHLREEEERFTHSRSRCEGSPFSPKFTRFRASPGHGGHFHSHRRHSLKSIPWCVLAVG